MDIMLLHFWNSSKKAQKNEKAVTLVSADAKCKALTGQPEFSFEAVSYGKNVGM